MPGEGQYWLSSDGGRPVTSPINRIAPQVGWRQLMRLDWNEMTRPVVKDKTALPDSGDGVVGPDEVETRPRRNSLV
jgi:hypothetical protein